MQGDSTTGFGVEEKHAFADYRISDSLVSQRIFGLALLILMTVATPIRYTVQGSRHSTTVVFSRPVEIAVVNDRLLAVLLDTDTLNSFLVEEDPVSFQ